MTPPKFQGSDRVVTSAISRQTTQPEMVDCVVGRGQTPSGFDGQEDRSKNVNKIGCKRCLLHWQRPIQKNEGLTDPDSRHWYQGSPPEVRGRADGAGASIQCRARLRAPRVSGGSPAASVERRAERLGQWADRRMLSSHNQSTRCRVRVGEVHQLERAVGML